MSLRALAVATAFADSLALAVPATAVATGSSHHLAVRQVNLVSDQAGKASGATNAIRELGGVLGIAVLATVFTSHGGYESAAAFVSGLTPAMWVGAAVLAVGAVIPLVVPFNTRASAEAQASLEAAERQQSARGASPVLAGEAA